MSLNRALSTIRRRISAHRARHWLANPLIVTILVAVLVGTTSGEVLARADQGDHVVIGNTGGTLSGVVQVNGARIVIGGGNARTDLADLWGRSTLPWNRRVNLLIVPGWDDQQSIGALGLVERGGVQQLVIAGTPAESAVSRALQQAAAERGIPVTVVTGDNMVNIGDNASLELEAAPPSADASPEYMVAVLHYFDSSITFIDASADGVSKMATDGVDLDRTHILVEMRTALNISTPEDVLLQPRADSSASLTDSPAAYVGEVKSGVRVTVKLREHELRLPLDQLSAGDALQSSLSATP